MSDSTLRVVVVVVVAVLPGDCNVVLVAAGRVDNVIGLLAAAARAAATEFNGLAAAPAAAVDELVAVVDFNGAL